MSVSDVAKAEFLVSCTVQKLWGLFVFLCEHCPPRTRRGLIFDPSDHPCSWSK